jgi:hypothetical protein
MTTQLIPNPDKPKPKLNIYRHLIFGMFFMVTCVNVLMGCGKLKPQPIDAIKEVNIEISEPKIFQPDALKLDNGITTIGEIPLPPGYNRMDAQNNSFHQFLINVKIDQKDNVVHLFNGEVKPNQNAHFAILDIDVGNKDLQQCADAVMRLRGEYLFKNNQKEDISFLFTNGDRVYFKQWARGFRPNVSGNRVTWSMQAAEDYSYASFRKFMDLIFTYSGTLSLSKELKKVPNFDDILPGDVIIIGGSPGHAVLVVDMAVHETTGRKIFLLVQSYMPAQEIHILKNDETPNLSPWYHIPDGNNFPTPEYFFTKDNLMRFSTP